MPLYFFGPERRSFRSDVTDVQEGLNRSLLDFQARTESGACPDSVLTVEHLNA